MKKFIFIVPDIHAMGGVQNHVRCKLKYLLKDGWKTYILYTESNSDQSRCPFRELEPYVKGKMYQVCTLPSVIGTMYQTIAVSALLEIIEYAEEEKDDYIIESTGSYEAVWGEILSKEIGGKHICFICNEYFREPFQWYTKFMEFFEFKYNRAELAGIADNSLKMLFDGYKDVEVSDRYVLNGLSEDTVQDIDSKRVSELQKKDWNIAYIGRCEKKYFPVIIEEVAKFAQLYPEKEMQFIVVGELKDEAKVFLDKLKGIQNVSVTYLGYFSPMPRSLFKKLDVVLGGAGCGYFSFKEGVPTIVPDAKTCKAIGIYGYTVMSELYGEKEYSYVELLEDVLVTKKYLQYKKAKINAVNGEDAYHKFFTFVKLSCSQKEYYEFKPLGLEMDRWEKSVLVQFLLERLESNKTMRSLFLKKAYQKMGESIGLFGYGVMGKAVKRRIPELKFEIIYDNSVIDKEIVRPSAKNLEQVQTILVSPLNQEKKISDELKEKNYGGKIVFLYDFITGFFKDFLYPCERNK